MSHQPVRKTSCRNFKPSLSLLEERCTPTVNSLSVAGLTPGMGGSSSVSINGIVSDSNSVSASTLAIKYTVTDGQGNVLLSGPLTLNPAFPNSLSYSYQTTIARSVAPGNIETINVFAADSDSMGVPLEASANLYVSTVRGTSTLGFGSTASNGDLFGGSGQGRMTVTQSTTKGLIVKGKASFQLGSNPSNQGLITATANGPFQFGVDPSGTMSLKITGGKTNFKLGSYAGGPLSKGGLGGLVTGNFTYTRFIDSSINFKSQGSTYFSAQIGGPTTTTTTANTVNVLSNKIAINFTRDSAGNLRFIMAGKSTINGSFNKNRSFDIFG
jgi:hypothetical protein